MAAKKKAKKAERTAKKSKSTARAHKAAPVRKAAKKRAAAAKAPKRGKARAAARKPAAKARAAKAKAPARATKAAKATRAKAKPAVRRRDRPGHIDPKYARELRSHSEPPEADPQSFIEQPRAGDDLAEEMGEEAVATATTGEYEAEDMREQDVPEEVGGPFVQTTPGEEFAQGTDPSNPKDATREPFPRT